LGVFEKIYRVISYKRVNFALKKKK